MEAHQSDGGEVTRRDEILAIAVELFGRDGFDACKYADIAAAAGIGQTSLYHHFQSKVHCLFETLLIAYRKWDALFAKHFENPADGDYVAALARTARAMFEITEHEVLVHRLLVREEPKLATLQTTGRELEVQTTARQAARRIEQRWVDFLSAAMNRGELPRRDPRLLARSSIGMLQSAWHWYRPGGAYTLQALADFQVAALLRLVCTPDVRDLGAAKRRPKPRS